MGKKKTQGEEEFDEALEFTRHPEDDPNWKPDNYEADDDDDVDEGDEVDEGGDDLEDEGDELEGDEDADEGDDDQADKEEGDEKDKDDPVYTLPGGKKITLSEFIKDPELIGTAVTGWNAQSHQQTLAEERAAETAQIRQQHQELLNRVTQAQLNQQQQVHQAQVQEAQQTAFQRPTPDHIRAMYAPAIAQLKEAGRITEDNAEEMAGPMSEVMFDLGRQNDSINGVIAWVAEQFQNLRSEIPDLQRIQQHAMSTEEASVQKEAATKPGYEDLADPETWDKLKAFINEDVQESRGADGRPTYNPPFTPRRMQREFDAMIGPLLRDATKKVAKQATADKQTRRKKAAGAGGKRGSRPKPKRPAKVTPESEAMDFSDPRKAMG